MLGGKTANENYGERGTEKPPATGSRCQCSARQPGASPSPPHSSRGTGSWEEPTIGSSGGRLRPSPARNQGGQGEPSTRAPKPAPLAQQQAGPRLPAAGILSPSPSDRRLSRRHPGNRHREIRGHVRRRSQSRRVRPARSFLGGGGGRRQKWLVAEVRVYSGVASPALKRKGNSDLPV